MQSIRSFVGSNAWQIWLVQGVFLFTGVFSTCAAQFIYYQGAGDQKAILLPLCNYLGMMLVGLIPISSQSENSTNLTNVNTAKKHDQDVAAFTSDEDDASEVQVLSSGTGEPMELTRRQVLEFDSKTSTSLSNNVLTIIDDEEDKCTQDMVKRSTMNNTFEKYASILQIMIGINVFLDFAGCIFSNIGLSMAGSGVYQVVYSSVVCWSAILSQLFLKKQISQEEWAGIALVTFGLAFSALGQSNGGRNTYVVLMGCLNTLIGAGFYGGNYVAGEFMLKLPERPQAKELCLRMGTICVAVIAIYQMFFVLPEWETIITKQVDESNGNPVKILVALLFYTISQLAHGLTYFMMLSSCGAITTGIMQSLRAVCVFGLSSVLYCSIQESQCFDTKRGVATLVVVAGVLFYSRAKANKSKAVPTTQIGYLQKAVLQMKNYIV